MIKHVSFDKLVGVTLGTYHIEQFLGPSDIGPTFLVRTGATTTYLLRLLVGSTALPAQNRAAYLERFQSQASQIASLRHPYLLPLLDFGVYRDLPYLISPHIPLRSLRTRIEKNGALNTFTVGRYLDQIAAALEYTHEHSVLHGSLSMDSIFIRLDGNVVAGDFGLKSLLSLSGDIPLEWSDGLAPEQLLGKPASPASDVYALGMVAYHLLTGHAVFDGYTPHELGQQHLYATIPPLTRWRNDLPPNLYSVLAHALAKDPAQRYYQPGAFANDYHQLVLPTNRTRMPFAIAEPLFVPDHGSSFSGSSQADLTFNETVRGKNRTPFSEQPPKSPYSLHGFSSELSFQAATNTKPGFMQRLQGKSRQRFILVASILLLLILAASTIGIALLSQKSSAMASASGQVIFFSSQNDPAGQTNALTITIQHLVAPPGGNSYQAWIINAQNEGITSLGKLTEQGKTWSLTYRGTNVNLLNIGGSLEITQEQGTVNAPTGKAILVGTFPNKAFQHIQHLLVGFPATPDNVGMLVGVVQQTHLLDIQAALLQNVATSQNPGAISCVTQSMLNIIEGTQGTHYQQLSALCLQQNVTANGDGFGLLGKGFLAGAEEHASLALSQPDATAGMRQHAALMDIALNNITGWVTTIEQDVLNLHAHPAAVASVQQITTLADDAYHGVDINGDGQIDPVAGEAGAITAYQQGQLMATLVLAPGTAS